MTTGVCEVCDFIWVYEWVLVCVNECECVFICEPCDCVSVSI